MRAPNHFIVSVPKTLVDTMKLGDKEIFLDSKYQEFENRISHGTIIAAPENHDTGAEEGDTLFFHHHVTTNTNLRIEDGVYISMYAPEQGQSVDHSLAYRKKSDGSLHMLADWVFVKPIDIVKEDIVSDAGIIEQVGGAVTGHRTDVAEVYLPNKRLEEEGVKVGDTVGFDKNSDYKLKLDDGEVVFRMKINDISYVLHDS